MSKTVVVGVTGGIAVYKALDVISRLKKQGIDVHVIMTKSATEFVTPLSFQSLSQNMVVTDMFAEPKAWEIQHISLAQKADLFLVVPATANIIGKVANGIADDMLSTTIMATNAPVVFAPAMNTNMWNNPIVQDNISKLREYGYSFIQPASGRLACGDVGAGKLEDTERIVEYVLSKMYEPKDLKGKNVVITAGPTVTKIDPVRIMTNNSSGKMGYELAKEARDRGANVTLISGPTKLQKPLGVEVEDIKTNEEMYTKLQEIYPNSDIVIKCAAVADYKAKEYSQQKIKKSEGDLNIAFTRDTDIALELGRNKTSQILVGFAAESENVIENATKKLEKKNFDYIVANNVSGEDGAMGSDDNEVTILSKDGTQKKVESAPKREVAREIFDFILK